MTDCKVANHLNWNATAIPDCVPNLGGFPPGNPSFPRPTVIPAKAGIQTLAPHVSTFINTPACGGTRDARDCGVAGVWIPAFAGMTGECQQPLYHLARISSYFNEPLFLVGPGKQGRRLHPLFPLSPPQAAAPDRPGRRPRGWWQLHGPSARSRPRRWDASDR